MELILRAVLAGMAVMLAGTLPRNLLFAANLRYFPALPWAAPLTAAWLWWLWRFLGGGDAHGPAAEGRRAGLRANGISAARWSWALVAGTLGIVALVLALRVANRMLVLPQQQLPDLSGVPTLTLVTLLVMAAPVAGIVEEAAFRGYMQRPIEQRYGLPIAILVTGTMFAVAHLDFTLVLWPYYVAVAAIYGTIAWLTDSILPAIVLHTLGNLYSNFDLLLHGRAEWQAPAAEAGSVWRSGMDRSFLLSVGALLAVSAAMVLGYRQLARAGKRG